MTHEIFEITISVGRSRSDTNWEVRRMTWGDFVFRCNRMTRTPETMAQYDAMDSAGRGAVKDVGGFVGGVLRDGRRDGDHLENRTVVTLDLDRGVYDPDAVIDRVAAVTGSACLGYSTHSHRTGAPRVRICIPLRHPVVPDEYPPLVTRLVEAAGVSEYTDACSTRPAQLFYWGSASADAPVWTAHRAGAPWNGVVRGERSQTGAVSREVGGQRSEPGGGRVDDPLLKPGWVGAFCRTYYPMQKGIDTLLAGVYVKAGRGRYRYYESSSEAGLVIKDEGRLAYSNHTNSDPAADGHSHNIFDLCRIHMAGGSMERMLEIARDDEAVRMTYLKERGDRPEVRGESRQTPAGSRQEAATAEAERMEVMATLQLTRSGAPRDHVANVADIVRRDPGLRGMFRYNLFAERVMVSSRIGWWGKTHANDSEQGRDEAAWNDSDEAVMSEYLSRHYEMGASRSLLKGLLSASHERNYHPVREYLTGLRWDGVERAATLIIRALGAADNAANREMTRLFLIASVARVMRPGCKWDIMLILQGAQGTFKSTFVKRLFGDEWCCEDLDVADDPNAAAQKLRGYWGFELAELAGLDKADMNRVKKFLTVTSDNYRSPYGHAYNDHPRQCVFVGTTNDDHFLKDDENRRFMIIPVDGSRQGDNPGAMIDAERDQVWAEAYHLWATEWKDRPLVLSREATEAQRSRNKGAHMDRLDPVAADLCDYLEREIPVTWSDYTKTERRDYYQYGRTRQADGLMFEPQMMQRRRFALKAFLWEVYGVSNEVEAKRKTPALAGNLAKRIARMLRDHGNWGESKPLRDKVYGLCKMYEREVADDEL